MRAIVALALTTIWSCSPVDHVEMIGNRADTDSIRRLVEAAENRDEATFSKLIAKSPTMVDWFPPRIAEVDRQDEGCTLKRIYAKDPKMAEAIWDCPTKNYKREVERMFLIENGRVTYMWNDWGEGML